MAVLLLPLAGYGLARTGAVPEGTPTVLALLCGIIGPVLLAELCEERAPFRHSSSHLTARTLTGERSLDLNGIATVRLLMTFSYGGPHRTLVVRDAHGVRLGITTKRSAGSCAERSRRPTRTPREESPAPG
ncbi:hypothetical protein ACWGDS_06825 [Streptomyces sp. NPDC055059]|uniref:hypothetical protein n=1 Tax=Streptomyces sp. NPDC127172 TaxID=3345382 RepID=UPI0036328335